METASLAHPSEGLTATEAASRLTQHGPNEVERERTASPLALLFRQFKNPVVWLLLAAAVIAAALGEVVDAIAIGAIAGIVCFLAVQLRTRSALDDSLDVVAVHGIGGLWGALATGIFIVAASESGGSTAAEVQGLLHGGTFEQLGRQAAGVAIVAPFSFIVSFIILKALDLTVGVRVSEEDEVSGLDVSQHGERGYIFGGAGPVLGIPEAIPMHTPSSATSAQSVASPSGAAQ